MRIERGGRGFLRQSLLHRQLQCYRHPQAICHVPSRRQSTGTKTVLGMIREDPEFQKFYASNNPRFPWSLCHWDIWDNVDFDDTRICPIPEVFPHDGEKDNPIGDIPWFHAMQSAYLRPRFIPSDIQRLAKYRKLSISQEEVLRKLHLEERPGWSYMDVIPGNPTESALYFRLAPEYLSIATGREAPGSNEWINFLLSLTYSMGEWDAEEQLDEIQEYYLVQPAIYAVRKFLEALSLPGTLDNAELMVTENFYQYLYTQFFMANTYRPIFNIDLNSMEAYTPRPPYILLGRSRVFELQETIKYGTQVSPPKEFGITKIRAPIPEPKLGSKLKEYMYVTRYNNVAVGYPSAFPIPVPFTYRQLIKNMSQYGRPFFAHHLERGTLREALKEVTSPANELGFIVDIPMEARIGVDIVDENNQVVGGQKMELRRFMVTLRSNHVAPGWAFSNESVRWYIDDINMTKRRINWGDPNAAR